MSTFFHLSLGGDVRVRIADIVGVFDLDGRVTPADTASLLRAAERGQRAKLAGDDLPKAFVLLKDGSVVFTPYSAATIHERLTASST